MTTPQTPTEAPATVSLTDPISVFGFSPRVHSLLERWGITTVGHLLACDGWYLLDIRSFGHESLDEVIQTLARHGLELKKPTTPLPVPRRTTAKAEVSAQQARVDFARLLRDAEYGQPTVITRYGEPVAKLIPAGGVRPHPQVWADARVALEDAQAAYDDAPAATRRAIDALGTLLSTYQGGEQ
ncbi:type II toxin-antitoxin system prevent-host-death family antitoxin [Actinoallomurus purpureus]|uniref:type II toxin-antitoxin system Phd/YefM family antitoxin n=1 Tax=Actinoallomurus purpureus TaxID=478114 RepID=UPI002092B3CA|nr:type II toxin-antitoxin system prevent-host-death family antitoxin [Actinoallomurus purpureus]MCO6011531.1 type II toxin-antitoxin system prevent-host-death family antitoxin [Actinoallomurus purpureus]